MANWAVAYHAQIVPAAVLIFGAAAVCLWYVRLAS